MSKSNATPKRKTFWRRLKNKPYPATNTRIGVKSGGSSQVMGAKNSKVKRIKLAAEEPGQSQGEVLPTHYELRQWSPRAERYYSISEHKTLGDAIKDRLYDRSGGEIHAVYPDKTSRMVNRPYHHEGFYPYISPEGREIFPSESDVNHTGRHGFASFGSQHAIDDAMFHDSIFDAYSHASFSDDPHEWHPFIHQALDTNSIAPLYAMADKIDEESNQSRNDLRKTLPDPLEVMDKTSNKGKRYYSRRQYAKKEVVGPNQGFLSALRNVRSGNQQSLHMIAEDINNKLGIKPYKTHDAIHDAAGQAYASLMQVIERPEEDGKAEYAAAHFGRLTNQPGVLIFHAHDEGPDSLYAMHLAGNPDDIKVMLDQHNIPQRTLTPTDQGYRVHIFDKGRGLRPSIEQFARTVNATVHESTGTGRRLVAKSGNGNGADAPTFADLISAYEWQRSGSPQSGTDPQAGSVQAGSGERSDLYSSASPSRRHDVKLHSSRKGIKGLKTPRRYGLRDKLRNAVDSTVGSAIRGSLGRNLQSAKEVADGTIGSVLRSALGRKQLFGNPQLLNKPPEEEALNPFDVDSLDFNDKDNPLEFNPLNADLEGKRIAAVKDAIRGRIENLTRPKQERDAFGKSIIEGLKQSQPTANPPSPSSQPVRVPKHLVPVAQTLSKIIHGDSSENASEAARNVFNSLVGVGQKPGSVDHEAFAKLGEVLKQENHEHANTFNWQHVGHGLVADTIARRFLDRNGISHANAHHLVLNKGNVTANGAATALHSTLDGPEKNAEQQRRLSGLAEKHADLFKGLSPNEIKRHIGNAFVRAAVRANPAKFKGITDRPTKEGAVGDRLRKYQHRSKVFKGLKNPVRYKVDDESDDKISKSIWVDRILKKLESPEGLSKGERLAYELAAHAETGERVLAGHLYKSNSSPVKNLSPRDFKDFHDTMDEILPEIKPHNQLNEEDEFVKDGTFANPHVNKIFSILKGWSSSVGKNESHIAKKVGRLVEDMKRNPDNAHEIFRKHVTGEGLKDSEGGSLLGLIDKRINGEKGLEDEARLLREKVQQGKIQHGRHFGYELMKAEDKLKTMKQIQHELPWDQVHHSLAADHVAKQFLDAIEPHFDRKNAHHLVLSQQNVKNPNKSPRINAFIQTLEGPETHKLKIERLNALATHHAGMFDGLGHKEIVRHLGNAFVRAAMYADPEHPLKGMDRIEPDRKVKVHRYKRRLARAKAPKGGAYVRGKMVEGGKFIETSILQGTPISGKKPKNRLLAALAMLKGKRQYARHDVEDIASGIRENPADPVHRLIYSDALQEIGHDETAHHQRLIADYLRTHRDPESASWKAHTELGGHLENMTGKLTDAQLHQLHMRGIGEVAPHPVAVYGHYRPGGVGPYSDKFTLFADGSIHQSVHDDPHRSSVHANSMQEAAGSLFHMAENNVPHVASMLFHHGSPLVKGIVQRHAERNGVQLLPRPNNQPERLSRRRRKYAAGEEKPKGLAELPKTEAEFHSLKPMWHNPYPSVDTAPTFRIRMPDETTFFGKGHRYVRPGESAHPQEMVLHGENVANHIAHNVLGMRDSHLPSLLVRRGGPKGKGGKLHIVTPLLDNYTQLNEALRTNRDGLYRTLATQEPGHLAKILATDWVLGDSDAHHGNYGIHDGKVKRHDLGEAWHDTDVRQPMRSALVNAMDAARLPDHHFVVPNEFVQRIIDSHPTMDKALRVLEATHGKAGAERIRTQLGNRINRLKELMQQNGRVHAHDLWGATE